MNKKLILYLIIGLFLATTVNAWGTGMDNWDYRKCLTFTEPHGIAWHNNPTYYNFTGINITTTNATQELRLQWNGTGTVELQIIENGTNWYYILFPQNATASTYYEGENSTCIYYGNSGATDPAYTDRVTNSTDCSAADCLFDGTDMGGNIEYDDATLNYDGGVITAITLDGSGGTQIIDETFTYMNSLHMDLGGEHIFLDTEVDDVCTHSRRGTGNLEEMVVCESGEDSNTDGTCDSGETCATYYFRYNDIQTNFTIGTTNDYYTTIAVIDESVDGNWYVDSTNINGIQDYEAANGYAVNDMTTSDEMFQCFNEDGTLISDMQVQNNAGYDLLNLGQQAAVPVDYFKIEHTTPHWVKTIIDTASGALNSDGQNWEKRCDNPIQYSFTLGSEENITTCTNFTITATSTWNGTSISAFNATIDGTLYTTLTGTITTNYCNENGNVTNITVHDTNNWYNTTHTNYNVSTNLATTLQPLPITITNVQITGTDRVGSLQTLTCAYTNSASYAETRYNTLNNTGDNNVVINFNSTTTYTYTNQDFADTFEYNCTICTAYYCNNDTDTINVNTIDKLIYYRAYGFGSTLISNPRFNITETSESLAGQTYPRDLLDYINDTTTTRNITISVEDLDDLHQDITGNITNLTENVTYIDFTLTPHNLILNFSANVSGVIRDSNPIDGVGDGLNFTQTSLVVVQQNLSQGAVMIRFNPSGGNWTQYYEYINDLTPESATLKVLSSVDSYKWIRVVDESNNPLENAIVRIYELEPTTGGLENYTLIGQRLTDHEGYTYYQFNTGNHYLEAVSLTGYTTERVLYEVQDVIQVNRDDADIIKLSESDTGTLTMCQYYIHNEYTGNLANIYSYVYCPERTTITYTTNYANTSGIPNNTATSDSLDRYLIQLTNLTHFDTSLSNDIQVWIYDDGELIINHTISYDSTTYTEILTSTEIATLDTTILSVILGIILIIASAGIGIVFPKTGTAGHTTFMFGGILLSFISTTFLYLSLVCLLYFIGRVVHRAIRE